MDDEELALLETVVAILQEHFETFALVGYAMDGSRRKLISATTPMKRDALVKLMEDWVKIDFETPSPVEVYEEIEDDGDD